jgi:hypothetical protein
MGQAGTKWGKMGQKIAKNAKNCHPLVEVYNFDPKQFKHPLVEVYKLRPKTI